MNISDFEGMELTYGKCPNCGENCQPSGAMVDEEIPFEEYVFCCNCKIHWTLHVEDPSDKLDETEPWREYRISDIRTFADEVCPNDCE